MRYYVSDYDVMSAYQETRMARIAAKRAQEDQEVMNVANERQSAEQQRIAMKERAAALQQQAAAWQNQMDTQATEQAQMIRQWKKENSFGAHARRIFAGVLNAGIGSFTGGLTNVLANELVDEAIDELLD